MTYKVWARMISATKFETIDQSGEPKDLLLVLTAQAELMLVDFGVKEVTNMTKVNLNVREED